MMTDQVFIGREKELERLNDLYKKKQASLAVIKGRRRVGKSRLVAHFAKVSESKKIWSFSGLAPQDGMDDQTQRDHFARQLAAMLKQPPFSFHDWSDAFAHLSRHLSPGDMVLMDEISWMGSGDSSFIPKLKAWWDQQSLPVFVVFCGSISTWIQENIIQSTAFFGRINLIITLEPLSIAESAQLLKAYGFQGSDYDVYKLLSVLGGIPWYLEQVIPGYSADELIRKLCFQRDSMLVLEFDRIFYDLFGKKGTSYKKILDSLKGGMKTLADVRKEIAFAHSGTLSNLMGHLITAGFVQKQEVWSFKTVKPRKQSLYRISDPYMRFYLKLIEPNLDKIKKGAFESMQISKLQGFDAHIGLQIEHLLLYNRKDLLKAIGIDPSDVVADGAYRQTKTSSKAGCQIDYIVQTVTHNLYVCEFKFKRREITGEVMQQVKDKIHALSVPRGFACIPVLFHIGGVCAMVQTSGYFYRIIDIKDFLRRE